MFFEKQINENIAFDYVKESVDIQSYIVDSENFLKQKDFLSGDGIMGGLKNSSLTEISIRIPELSEQKEIVQIF